MVEGMLPQDRSKLRIDPVSEPDIEQALASLQACPSAYGQSGRDLYLLQATRFEERLGLLGIDFVPGRTASLIGPQIDSTATLPEQISRGLLGQANCLLQRCKVRLGQVLLDRQQEPESAWYRDCGYEMVIPVDLLARSIEGPRLPKFPQLPGEVQWLVYRSENRDRFLRALTASYKDSQDCAELSGHREPEDLLTGPCAGGPSRPALWQLLQLEGQDAGCLLLREQPEAAQCEIAYLGLAPQFRGRGLGYLVTQHALQQARELGYPRLILAVDAKNEPAQQLYARMGFICFSRKQVQICIFTHSQ